MLRRALGVAAQFVDAIAGGGVPDAADHVVGHARDPAGIRRHGDLPDPALVGDDGAQHVPLRGVPPDQPVVIAAGNGQVAGEADAGDVAAMIGELLRRASAGRRRQLEDLARRAGDEQAVGVGHAGNGEQDVGTAELTHHAEVPRLALGHGKPSGSGTFYASTSRTGCVPGSVSGTGRSPTW